MVLTTTYAVAIYWTDNNGFDSRNVPCYPNGTPVQYQGAVFGPDTPQDSLTASGLILQGYVAPAPVVPVTPAVTYPTQAQVQNRLTNAYNSYLNARFNSIGVYLVLAGVQNSKPDSLAVKVWMNQLSSDYRTR